MLAIQLHHFGTPDSLVAEQVPMPTPAEGEALVQVSASGLNFADTLLRQDRYAFTPALPVVLGNEVVGRLAQALPAHGLSKGQRVAVPLFASNRMGGYAEYVAADVATLVPVPERLPDDIACALQVQGLTASALARRVPVQGRRVLVTAAAGGVGSLLVQLLKRAGAAQVVAAASSADKRRFALELGADVAVDYTRSDWVHELQEITAGGPDVILDSAGGDVTSQCLEALGPSGTMVIYGALNIQSFAFGVPELKRMIFKNQALSGFAFVPLLTPATLREDLQSLFELALSGGLRVHIDERLKLVDAPRGHALLESRSTRGKLVLVL
jgi:NADPH:quinone reductase